MLPKNNILLVTETVKNPFPVHLERGDIVTPFFRVCESRMGSAVREGRIVDGPGIAE